MADEACGRRFDFAGHDNNLNLIRVLAASAVLVSHAWPLTYGKGTVEPLETLLRASLGTISVYVFFAVSGLLIAASFSRSGSVRRFLEARATRLLPGLFVSLVLVAFVLGPLVTTLPLWDYLSHLRVWRFLAVNMTLISSQYNLPGVFETNPFPAVEGSIWTLVYEVSWYAVVLFAGLLGLLERRFAMLGLVLATVGAWYAMRLTGHFLHPRLPPFVTMGMPFSMGMLVWAWRDRIPASGWLALALCLPGALVIVTPLALPAFMVALVYGTFWLAYVPGGWVRRYNRLGDYSYGIYIYAFPVQGLVMWITQTQSVALHIALAFPPTLLLAILSWHFVESPAMQALRRNQKARIKA